MRVIGGKGIIARIAAGIAGAALVLSPGSPAAAQDHHEHQRGNFKDVKPYPPLLEFPDESLNLGIIRPGESKITRIKVHNPEDDTLKVTRVRGSCPCITVIPKPDVIQPGETVEWVMHVDVPDTLGPFSRRLLVDCEGYARPSSTPVVGDITWGVRVRADGKPSVRQRAGTLTLESVDGEPFRVLSVNGKEPEFVEYDPSSGETRERYTLRYEVPGSTMLDIPRWIVIETDHPDAPLIDVKVDLPQLWKRWRPGGRWRWFESRVRLDDMPLGGSTEFTAAITGLPFDPDRRIRIRSASDTFRAELVEARKPSKGGGTEVVVRVHPEHEEPGVLIGVVEAEHDGMTSGLDVFGRVGR